MEEQKAEQVLLLHSKTDILSFANQLKEFIVKQKLSCNIKGNEYAYVDGWKYAGLNFGCVSIPDEPVVMHKDGEVFTVLYKKAQKLFGQIWKDVEVPFYAGQIAAEIERNKAIVTKTVTIPLYKYKCSCKIVNSITGQQVGSGSAVCTNMELSKIDFDEYAVASMAQTRCIGKGFRNVLGFIMKAAGYQTTPAEEMQEVKVKEEEKKQTDTGIPEDIIGQIDLLVDGGSTEKQILAYAEGLPAYHKHPVFRKKIAEAITASKNKAAQQPAQPIKEAKKTTKTPQKK